MSDRERWFRVSNGAGCGCSVDNAGVELCIQLPGAISEELSFNLSIGDP